MSRNTRNGRGEIGTPMEKNAGVNDSEELINQIDVQIEKNIVQIGRKGQSSTIKNNPEAEVDK